MDYSETIRYLYSSQPVFHLQGSAAYKPGLQTILSLCAALGNPQDALRTIHIAGTNGKGSTSSFIASALQTAGYKTGLFTSPHLVSFRERIRVNGEMITEEGVVEFVERYKNVLEELSPSFFETTTAMALWWFRKQGVDIAVIEVGLGGRLDSTNIIHPLLSVITNIGYDHTEFLGTTLPEIAREKAGIIKEGVAVVIGEHGTETDEVFRTAAANLGSPIYFAQDEAVTQPYTPIADYQKNNLLTAMVALEKLPIEISRDSMLTGFKNVNQLTGLRGRWETLQQNPKIVCDTGHNSHGIRYVASMLRRELQTLQGTMRIVFGMVSDKDVDIVLSLLPQEAVYYFCQATTKRAIDAEELLRMGWMRGLNGQCYKTVKDAMEAAKNDAKQEDFIFIGGSNYVVGEALQTENK